MRRLERLDKDEYSTEERNEAEEIYEQRRQKELEEASSANPASNGLQTGDRQDDIED